MLIRYKLLFLFFCCCSSWQAYAQKENNIWYFGNGAGIDFNSGKAKAIQGGMNQLEGCASVSNRRTGELFFYTDGRSVWNKNHQRMPSVKKSSDWMYGHWSSTQSALIVPMPGDSLKYYIFTADQGGYWPNPRGINYSIVDMTRDNGIGDVTTKNIPLLAGPATEKLAGVWHCDGKDIWVLAHSWKNNNIYAWLVTEHGIEQPIVSSVGVVHKGGDMQYTIGYLRGSPNGKTLAMATTYMKDFVEVFDFNNATGVVSNSRRLASDSSVYGICFSSDNSRLYVSSWNSPDRRKATHSIWQFNLLAGGGHPDSISASKVLIGNTPGSEGGAIQLGPDGKIYVAGSMDVSLGVVNYPNELGAGCMYVNKGLDVLGLVTDGLPNIIDGSGGIRTVQFRMEVESLGSLKPGDIGSIPIVIENSQHIKNATKISLEIHTDPDLLRFLDKPYSAYGTVKKFVVESDRILLEIEVTSTLDSGNIVIASLPAQALLAPRAEGQLEIFSVNIEQSKIDDCLMASGSVAPFEIDESCVKPESLRSRGTITVSSVYPNPSRTRATLEVISHNNPRVRIEVYDTFGRQMERLHDGDLPNGKHEMTINTENYAIGIYFCRVSYNRQITTKAFTVLP